MEHVEKYHAQKVSLMMRMRAFLFKKATGIGHRIKWLQKGSD
jgi:hypothetical protein